MSHYEKLRGLAQWKTADGDSISSRVVYWSARQQIASHRVVKGDLGYGRAFSGKISSGDCVDVATATASPTGLMAPKIVFFCDRQPRPGPRYHRSNTDQGMCGLIKENVLCKVMSSYAHASARQKRRK